MAKEWHSFVHFNLELPISDYFIITKNCPVILQTTNLSWNRKCVILCVVMMDFHDYFGQEKLHQEISFLPLSPFTMTRYYWKDKWDNQDIQYRIFFVGLVMSVKEELLLFISVWWNIGLKRIKIKTRYGRPFAKLVRKIFYYETPQYNFERHLTVIRLVAKLTLWISKSNKENLNFAFVFVLCQNCHS